MFKKYLNAQVDVNKVNLSLLILRISIGGMMLTHGIPKFMKLLSGDFAFADPLGIGAGFTLFLAVSTEFLGSLMIITGLGTRFGAFLGVSTMAVAAFIQHGADPFGTKEKALLYLVGYIVLVIAGSGKYSLDAKLK